ncbi:J domain-containing protein [Natronorubrum sp. FCH18a]|uniref:J domain-containing protein n=1 Tax=Natronorubrum sp. FCH18a TaxID=3447018 RepID=UPI003F50F80B
MKHHYDILGVSLDADQKEIKRAYRALIKEHHPDHGGSQERFFQLKRAYEAATGIDAETNTDLGVLEDRESTEDKHPENVYGRSLSKPESDPTYDPKSKVCRSKTGYELRADGDLLTVSLVALTDNVLLSSLAGEINSNIRRPVAFFEVKNTSDKPLEWHGQANTTFIGDDGFMYEGSDIISPYATALPERWCATQVLLEPGRVLDAVVIAQNVPKEVSIKTVIYTQDLINEAAEDTERYLFDIKPEVRNTLNCIPFDLV